MGSVTVIGLQGALIQHIFMGIAYIVAAVSTFTLHGRNARRLMREGHANGMSTATVIFHVSFALASIATVLGAVFSGVSSLFGRWIYNDAFCQWYAFEGMLGGMAQIYSLVLMCLDRYVQALHPGFYERRLASSKAKPIVGVLIVWTSAFVWAMLPMLGIGRYALEPQGTSCTIDWADTSDSSITYLTNLVVVSFAWPCGLALLLLILANIQQPGNAQNRLLNYLFFFDILSWTPFAALTIINLIEPIKQISLIAVYTAPLTAKLGMAALPLIYDAAFFKPDQSGSKQKRS